MIGARAAGVAFGLGLSVLAAVPAQAADLPPARAMARAPAYVPFFTWIGLYVGVNGGYGFGKSRWTDTVTTASTGDFDVTGAMAGGTLGYNMQLGSSIFGLEGDFDWSNIKGSTTTACPTTCETSLAWLATARARVGYAFDRFLPYLTGGAAFGRIKGAVTGFGSTSSDQIGWTAGGGIEYAFTGGFSFKVEYLYLDLGTARCDTGCSGANPFDVSFTANLVRGGLNYKF